MLLPYITERLKGGAIVQLGELAIGETEEGVVIEPEVETQIADGADQLAGAAGVYVIKAGLQVRMTLTRFSAAIYAAALGLAADTSGIPNIVAFSWPAYLPQMPMSIIGTLANGKLAVWKFPNVSVIPSAGVTLSREPASLPVVVKVLVDPANTASFGHLEVGSPTP